MAATATLERRHTGLESAATRCDGRRPGVSLSRNEEVGRAERIAAGDQEARDRLVQSGLGLVPTIARGFLGRGLDLDDLVGEGNLGLIRAAERFDPGFGIPFHAYASCRIKWAIRTALSVTVPLVRLPAYLVKILTRWRRAERRIRQERGRAPSFDEVASSLGLEGNQKCLVLQALQLGRTRMNATGGDGPDRLAEEVASRQAPPEEAVEEREEWAAMLRTVERLDGRERTALKLYFGLRCEPITFREIGERIGLSREMARLLVLRALDRLGESCGDGSPRARRTGSARACTMN